MAISNKLINEKKLVYKTCRSSLWPYAFSLAYSHEIFWLMIFAWFRGSHLSSADLSWVCSHGWCQLASFRSPLALLPSLMMAPAWINRVTQLCSTQASSSRRSAQVCSHGKNRGAREPHTCFQVSICVTLTNTTLA